jgi:invasion protein IalB
MKNLILILSGAAALWCASSFLAPAVAGEPRLMGVYGDWDAYVFIENGNKVCYMASQPQKDEGKYSKRGEIYALITHRPSEGTRNVFSYIAGYSYKTGSDATISIGDQTFKLFTQDDTAWAPDADTDKKITDAVRSGSSMIVKGSSSRGTATKDTFSLKGSGEAYDRISKECGY